MNIKTCGQCALKLHDTGACAVFHQNFPDDQIACPQYTKTLYTCKMCGASTIKPDIVIEKGEYNKTICYMICQDCSSKSGTCATCNKQSVCTFQTDPSPIPQVINKEFRKGNIITVTQVINPARVDITCKKGCVCFDPEIGCLKQFNNCKEWEPSYEEI
jgi:hypothetical protein